MRVLVYHTDYGCDSGCCGHAVEIQNYLDVKVRESFIFAHPDEGESLEDFVCRLVTKEFGAEHCKDIDWENCVVLDRETCY